MLAALVVLVGVVGGLSVWLAVGLYRDLNSQAQEYEHVLMLDRAHSAFGDMAVHILQGDSAISDQATTDAVIDGEEFSRLTDDLVRSHRDNLDPPLDGELEALSEMRRHGTEVRAILQDLVSGSSAVVTADQARAVYLADREVHRLVNDLSELHRVRIERLLHASAQRINLIVSLYVAFLLLAGLLIVGAALFATQRVGLPLRRLAEAAGEIAAGRLHVRVPVQSDDEIGLLSASFNAMAGRLQDHESELQRSQQELADRMKETQALYAIGTEIARLQQLDRVLQSVVDKARELLHTDAAVLCLFQPDGEALEAEATSGPPEAFDSSPRDGCYMPDGANPEESAPPRVREAFARSHLSAGFRLRGGESGAICVCTRAERKFTLEESDLLTALATQASIAIDRARLSDMARHLATMEERGRLAREMHDGLAQSLGLLHLKLQHARTRLADPAALDTALAEMIQIADEAYEDVRQSILGLRVPVLRGSDLSTTIGEYLREFQIRNGIDVQLAVGPGRYDRVPQASEVQVIRIIQEALANVRRHAGVDRAEVRLERVQGLIRVTITDEGVGWDPGSQRNGAHYGLQTMRERAEGEGGSLKINTSPGGGTQIVAVLPGEGK
jgi:nitrate/nitrite-specific signal transduction histidine kinase